MADSSSLYGTTAPAGTVSSSNYTTLYSGGNNFVPSGDNVIISGTLTVNGCSILTDCNAFNLLPFNATTVNAFGSATAVSIGGATGVTTIQNQLATGHYLFPLADGANTQVLATNGAGVLYWANNNDFNTTYTIDASATTGGANFNLVGSDATTDTIKFAQGSGVSIVRTDANTITITNTDPGSAGVTSITGTANQVIASASTGAVTLSTPQDIATTSSPTFAGVNAGNITVGVVTDNTIGSTNTNGDIILQPNGNGDVNIAADTLFIGDGGSSAAITTNGTGSLYLNTNNYTNSGQIAIEEGVDGDILLIPFASGIGQVKTYNDFIVEDGVFFVDSTNNRVGINNTTPQYELHIDQGLDGYTQIGMTTNERTTILTMNDGDDLLSLSYGPNPAPGPNRLQFDPTDQWFNTGKLGVATATPAYTLDVNGNGYFNQGIELDGILQINGSSSGYSQFVAPATGSNLSYQLPSTAGAANTVLTNDGVGNLSWALPGGGGSTFGNITVGIVTDNTISTTTGNLILDSASGTIELNVPTITTDATTISLFPTTATTINIGGAGSNTPTDVINIGVQGQTYATQFGGLITQNGITTQAASKFLNQTTTSPILIMSTTRKSMKCIVTITDDVTGAIHSVEILAIRKTSTAGAWMTTYAEVYSDAPLATFTVTDTGTSLALYATLASTNSTDISVMRHSLGD